MNADRTGNVLDGLLAHILEAEAQLVAHLIMDVARNHDASGFGKSFQPRRHVDSITVDIILIADNVADIDSDAEFDALFGWYVGVALNHTALNVNGAAYGIDNA